MFSITRIRVNRKSISSFLLLLAVILSTNVSATPRKYFLPCGTPATYHSYCKSKGYSMAQLYGKAKDSCYAVCMMESDSAEDSYRWITLRSKLRDDFRLQAELGELFKYEDSTLVNRLYKASHKQKLDALLLRNMGFSFTDILNHVTHPPYLSPEKIKELLKGLEHSDYPTSEMLTSLKDPIGQTLLTGITSHDPVNAIHQTKLSDFLSNLSPKTRTQLKDIPVMELALALQNAKDLASELNRITHDQGTTPLSEYLDRLKIINEDTLKLNQELTNGVLHELKPEDRKDLLKDWNNTEKHNAVLFGKLNFTTSDIKLILSLNPPTSPLEVERCMKGVKTQIPTPLDIVWLSRSEMARSVLNEIASQRPVTPISIQTINAFVYPRSYEFRELKDDLESVPVQTMALALQGIESLDLNLETVIGELVVAKSKGSGGVNAYLEEIVAQFKKKQTAIAHELKSLLRDSTQNEQAETLASWSISQKQQAISWAKLGFDSSEVKQIISQYPKRSPLEVERYLKGLTQESHPPLEIFSLLEDPVGASILKAITSQIRRLRISKETLISLLSQLDLQTRSNLQDIPPSDLDLLLKRMDRLADHLTHLVRNSDLNSSRSFFQNILTTHNKNKRHLDEELSKGLLEMASQEKRDQLLNLWNLKQKEDAIALGKLRFYRDDVETILSKHPDVSPSTIASALKAVKASGFWAPAEVVNVLEDPVGEEILFEIYFHNPIVPISIEKLRRFLNQLDPVTRTLLKTIPESELVLALRKTEDLGLELSNLSPKDSQTVKLYIDKILDKHNSTHSKLNQELLNGLLQRTPREEQDGLLSLWSPEQKQSAIKLYELGFSLPDVRPLLSDNSSVLPAEIPLHLRGIETKAPSNVIHYMKDPLGSAILKEVSSQDPLLPISEQKLRSFLFKIDSTAKDKAQRTPIKHLVAALRLTEGHHVDSLIHEISNSDLTTYSPQDAHTSYNEAVTRNCLPFDFSSEVPRKRYQKSTGLCWAFSGSELVAQKLCQLDHTYCDKAPSVVDISRNRWKPDTGYFEAGGTEKQAIEVAIHEGVCMASDTNFYSERTIIDKMKDVLSGPDSCYRNQANAPLLENEIKLIAELDRLHQATLETTQDVQNRMDVDSIFLSHSREEISQYLRSSDSVKDFLGKAAIGERCIRNRVRLTRHNGPTFEAVETKIGHQPFIETINQLTTAATTNQSILSLGFCSTQFESSSPHQECGGHAVNLIAVKQEDGKCLGLIKNTWNDGKLEGWIDLAELLPYTNDFTYIK